MWVQLTAFATRAKLISNTKTKMDFSNVNLHTIHAIFQQIEINF